MNRETLRSVMSELGKSRSPKKLKAVRANLAKAQKAKRIEPAVDEATAKRREQWREAQRKRRAK